MLYSKLFQVSLEVEDAAPGELWHPDVYKLAVRDLENNGSLMGHIYCDFFSREDKAFQVRYVFNVLRAMDRDRRFMSLQTTVPKDNNKYVSFS